MPMKTNLSGRLFRRIVFLGMLILMSRVSYVWQDPQAAQASQVSQENLKVSLETFVSKDGVYPGGTIEVAVVAHITENWHIHGPDPDLVLLIPAKMLFEETENIKILNTYYPEAELKKYDYWDDELEVYLENVTFGILVEISEAMPLGNQKIEGSFKYQACDDTSCRPPKTIPFEACFEVVPEYTEINTIHPDVFSQIHFKSEE
jgi:thiol:disulfide interchange protein DsbD